MSESTEYRDYSRLCTAHTRPRVHELLNGGVDFYRRIFDSDLREYLIGAGCIFDEYIALYRLACSDKKNGALYAMKYEARARLYRQLLCRLQRERLRRAS